VTLTSLAVEMNIVELFLFLLGLLLTVVIGKFSFPYMGWWVTLPAPILGYGLIVILVVGLNRLCLRRQRNGGEDPDQIKGSAERLSCCQSIGRTNVTSLSQMKNGRLFNLP